MRQATDTPSPSVEPRLQEDAQGLALVQGEQVLRAEDKHTGQTQLARVVNRFLTEFFFHDSSLLLI